MAKERTLTLFGRRIAFDGVPLGAEVRAYDRALQANTGKGADVAIVYALALACINYRLRPPTLLTEADLDMLPLGYETVAGITVLVEAIKDAMTGEKKVMKEKATPNPSTGNASLQHSAATTP